MIFLLAIAMSIAICLNMATIVLAPSIGIKGGGHWAGAWIGTNLHKNALGGTAALSCFLVGYAITDSRGWLRLAFCLTLLVSLVLLIGSRSISSLLAAAAMAALAFWARRLQRSPKELSVLTLILAIALVTSAIQLVGAGLIEGSLGFFGKDSNLSSRLPLWSLLWFYIEQRFWLGFGYEGFWQPGAPAVREIEAELYFTPFYAHNGLLETWLNGGAVLVALMLLLLCSTAVRSYRSIRSLAGSGDLVVSSILLRLLPDDEFREIVRARAEQSGLGGAGRGDGVCRQMGAVAALLTPCTSPYVASPSAVPKA